MGNPVVHFEIVSKDAAALRTFYSELFGWKIGPPGGGANINDYTLVEPQGHVGIDGGIGEAPEGYDGHVTFYISVPDIAVALANVEKRGGSTMMPPAPIPDGATIALFRDPEGHVVGLVQPPARM